MEGKWGPSKEKPASLFVLYKTIELKPGTNILGRNTYSYLSKGLGQEGWVVCGREEAWWIFTLSFSFISFLFFFNLNSS